MRRAIAFSLILAACSEGAPVGVADSSIPAEAGITANGSSSDAGRTPREASVSAQDSAGRDTEAPKAGAADAGSLEDSRDGGLPSLADASAPPGFADAGAFFPQDSGPQSDFSDLFQPSPPDGGTASGVRLESRQLDQSYPTPCGPPIEQGQVLRWVAPQTGTLRVAVASATPHQQLLQVDCGSLTTTKACAPDGVESELAIAIEESQQLCWLLGFEGDASVLATLTPAVCGDGVTNPGSEQCDLGDQLSGDGCDADCQFEVATANDGDTCPGVAQSVIDDVTVRGFTVGYSDQSPSACNALPGGSDRHHLVIPSLSGRLQLELEADFDAVLSVFTSCDDFSVRDLLYCSDGPRADAIERLVFPVIEKQHYYVTVDGYAPTSFGAYSLSMTLTPDSGPTTSETPDAGQTTPETPDAGQTTAPERFDTGLTTTPER